MTVMKQKTNYYTSRLGPTVLVPLEVHLLTSARETLVESLESTTLLEELEWHTTAMMCEWVVLLTARRVVWIIAIVIALSKFYI